MATIPAGLLHNPRWQALDGDGTPIAGAKLNSYEAGTSTPLALYSDSDLTTPLSNPVVADADGRFSGMYLQAQGYKLVLTDSDDVEVWTQDNVEDVGQTFLTELGTTFAEGSRNVTSGYTVLSTDNLVTVASTGGANPCVINLPAVSGRTFPLFIANTGTVALAVTPNGSDTINGSNSAYTVGAGSGVNWPWVLLLPLSSSAWVALRSDGDA